VHSTAASKNLLHVWTLESKYHYAAILNDAFYCQDLLLRAVSLPVFYLWELYLKITR